MKIVYLTSCYPKASHTFIQREIAALRANGVEVRTASIRRPDSSDVTGIEERAALLETFYILQDRCLLLNVIRSHTCILLRSPLRWIKALYLAIRTGRPGLKGFVFQFFYFLEAGILCQKLRCWNATHIHNHFGDACANVAMISAEMSGLPFSLTLHGPAEFFAPEDWRLDEKIRRCKFVICISHFARSQAMIFSDPEYWAKLKIVHCGVDAARYIGALERPSGIQVLYVARLTKLKGIRILFEAFRLAKEQIRDLRLVVIGDGPEFEWATKEAERIGEITMMGLRSQSEVAEELKRSDFLVLPSFAEGLPVVFMEALAASCPVIASRIAGVGELVVHDECGLLVSPGCVSELRDSIVRLALDEALRERMGSTGKERVQEHFDSRVEAARIKKLFCVSDAEILTFDVRFASTVE